MPLLAGSVTIAPDGSATGSGLALDLFNVEDAAQGGFYTMPINAQVAKALASAAEGFASMRAKAEAKHATDDKARREAIAAIAAEEASKKAELLAVFLASRSRVATKATLQAAAFVGHFTTFGTPIVGGTPGTLT